MNYIPKMSLTPFLFYYFACLFADSLERIYYVWKNLAQEKVQYFLSLFCYIFLFFQLLKTFFYISEDLKLQYYFEINQRTLMIYFDFLFYLLFYQ